MGCAVSSQQQPPPYPSIDAALEAGETQEDVDRYLKRAKSVTQMNYPCFVIKMSDFLELDRMRPHGEMVEAGLAVEWSWPLGPVNFLSHQWLSRDVPDPDGTQLRAVQHTFKGIIDGEDPFKTPEDWQRYSERWDYTKGAASSEKSMRCKKKIDLLASKTEVVTIEDFRDSVASGCVWLDFSAVPQIVDEGVAAGEAFWALQKSAIESIPSYVETAANFWVLAPSAVHKDSGKPCDLESWRRRGWCRVEDWINELSLHAHRPLHIDGTLKVSCEDFTDKMTHRALPRHAVLRGEFTCCAMGHQLNGAPAPCDKPRIAPVLRRVYDHKLQHLLSTGDLVNHAWFMCLKPSILAGDDATEHQFPPKEAISDFLQRYGWEGEDPAGSGAPSQAVFYPLFCAAVEGNLHVVEALLAAGADANRRLLGVGTSSLEAAALCGHVEVCSALLEKGADIDGASQFDGATAMIKAARGGATAVVELLLAQGADPSRADQEGHTPKDVAEAAGHAALSKMLAVQKRPSLAS